jgi:hypothetical protein
MKNTKVYLLFCELSNMLKIGVSDNVENRIKAIQACCPTKLLLIGLIPDDAGFILEQKLHARLANYREHGEWFRVADDVEVLINIVRSENYTKLYEFLDFEVFNPSIIKKDKLSEVKRKITRGFFKERLDTYENIKKTAKRKAERLARKNAKYC